MLEVQRTKGVRIERFLLPRSVLLWCWHEKIATINISELEGGWGTFPQNALSVPLLLTPQDQQQEKKNSSRKRTNKLVFKRSTRSSKSCYSWKHQEKPKGWKGSKRTKVLGNNVDVSKHIFRLPSASGDRGPEVFMIIDYWLHAWTVSFGSLVSTHHNSQLGAPFVKSKAQSNPRGSRPKRAPSRYVRLRSPWERKDR